MFNSRIQFDRDRLIGLCERHQVARLSVFGSALTDRFGPDSDIDMLVEFLPEAQPTYFDLVALEQQLADLFGRSVDLRTPAELSRYFRNRVMREAQVQYAA